MDIVPALPSLKRYANYLVRDKSDAEDLVQDTVARALANQHMFHDGNLRGWLMSVMHNLSVTKARHDYRRASISMPSGDSTLQVADTSDPTIGVMVRDITTNLNTLPRHTQVIILLASQYGLGYDEIAELLYLKLGTVRSRLSRGRVQLRELCGVTPQRHHQGGIHRTGVRFGPRVTSPVKLQIRRMTADLIQLHPDWAYSYAAARAVDSFLSAG